MIQPPDFRYTLTIEGQDYVLLNAPEGWEETFLNFKRSNTYHGLVRSFTVPLKLVLDGAFLVRNGIYRGGLGSSVILKIEWLQRENWKYRQLYLGEVDLVEFQDTGNSEGNAVSVRATDIGIAEMIATYDRAEYEIPLTDLNSVRIQLPGVSIIDVAQNLILPQPYEYASSGQRMVLPNSVEENELINGKIETRITDQEYSPNYATSSNWIVKANQETTVVISGVFEGTFGITNLSARVIIELVNQSGVVRAELINQGRLIVPQVSWDYSATVSLSSGEKLFLTIRAEGDPRGLFTVFYFPFRITNEILTPPIEVLGMRANDLFMELVARMNGGETGGAISNVLSQSNIYVTCGDAIREFANPVLKTNFQEFYKSMDAILNIGFGIDQVPRLEKKEFFYRNAPCIKVGEVKEFNLEIDQDYLYSSLNIGYKEQKYDQDQGRDEFNQGQSWSNKNKKTDKVLEIISPYRADQAGIAVLRRLSILDNLKGLDTESDNDIWMLQGSGIVESGLHKLELGADLDYVTGISNPENAINVRISPHRIMVANGSLLRIGLSGFESGVLKFGSADKNADLISQIDGKVVAERQDQSISALKTPLFLPYKVKIKTDLPINSWVIITNNMFGWIEFAFNGFLFKGYIKEASTDVARNSDREITLNLHPETDLTKLIR
jgi:hypothetical protein